MAHVISASYHHLLIASVGVLLACVVSASADITGRPFTVDLTGAAEVNADGVPNQGTGTAPVPQL